MIWRISEEFLQEEIFTQCIKIGNHVLLKFDNFFNPTYFEIVYSDFYGILIPYKSNPNSMAVS